MIKKDDAIKLRQLICDLRASDDLVNRFSQGNTNHGAEEVRQQHETSLQNLADFINEITEK